ncbi:D-alanyl-D-alanine carboxypeptidase/D-alanyl-D-alanine endopeptidase [Streptacidiphilus fuscans]|uniref:D-alanyl-D-alanine carboxypeptidase/D-alanyl-D-alanine endopeptidase n=1 Tax=Streptacidiphilus fuscans TaxID=2789292 RepID=UPI002E2B6BA6|nr:D-alanyl-D-alanine carboxypeptidase/D-alanyl-D-alanine-endopeptidase [Streptacidiphilus fuscans]
MTARVTARGRARAATTARALGTRLRPLLPHARRLGRRYAYAQTRQVAGIAGGTGLVLALVLITVTGPWAGGQRVSEQLPRSVSGGAHGAPRPAGPSAPSWQQAAAVLAPVGGAAGAAGTVGLPTQSGLSSALAGPLADPTLGTVTADVVDVADGRTLYSANADQPQTPASTNKLATATAALTLLGPDHRFTTRVVGNARTGLVLVGGGDATLSASTGPDSLTALAAATATALHAQEKQQPTHGKTTSAPIALHYDLSLFGAPALHPIGVNDNIALVQALTADEGRIDPTSTENAPRWPDPAAHAAAQFVAALAADGVQVAPAPTEGTAPAGAATLAQVQSAPLSDVVEQMLTNSDNDIAESLGHACAVAAHQPVTFSGGATAVMSTLTRLGVTWGSARLLDSSGLSDQDAIPARVLTQLLVLDASPAHPELRPIVTGLPVAGFTGTLDNRYGGNGTEAGLGVVRAKTGSLTSVNTLAGLVVDRSGRLLAFAFMSNAGGDATTARDGLDRLASAVAQCGCGG